MAPPPKHTPKCRPYTNCVDAFDPSMRQCVDGSWNETPLALIAEMYTWLTMDPQNAMSPLLLPLRRCLQREAPLLLKQLACLSRDDFKLPWER